MKSKNRTISKPVAPPKVVTNDAENLSARNISFVVQGQIQPETYTFLQALRRNFPEAELVLSTWRGKYDPCFRRITDKMIYCKDPGAVVCSYCREVAQWNNLNRQLVTTMAGLNAASRPFVAKVRTDFTLENSTLLSFWNRYPKRQSDALLFRHRIIVPSLYSRVYSDQPTALPVPFHPSDMFAFGRKDDMRRFFGSCPLLTEKELGNWLPRYPNRVPYPFCQWRWAPEQAIFYYAAKSKFPGLRFDDWTSFNKEILTVSKKLLMNNFIFVNPCQIGLFSYKHRDALRGANLHGDWPGLITNSFFEDWYKASLDSDLVVHSKNKGTAAERYELHKERMLYPLKKMLRSLGWFAEPFACLWYGAKNIYKR